MDGMWFGVGSVSKARVGCLWLVLLHPTVNVERPGPWSLGVVGCGMVIKETDLMEMLFRSGEGFGDGSLSAQIHESAKIITQSPINALATHQQSISSLIARSSFALPRAYIHSYFVRFRA
jgi:hypothetical protein